MSLSVWLKAGHTVEVMRRQSADFTAETGIEVDISVVPEGQAHDHLVSGARRPDVVTVPHWYLDELVDLDVLRPVGDPAAMPADARFPTAALSALSRSGSTWAVPHTLTGGVLSYRKDVLEHAGVAPPQTVDDVLSTARALAQTPGVDGVLHGLVARASGEFSSLETYSGWAWARALRVLPDTGSADPDVVEAAVGDLVDVLRATAPADLASRDYAAVGQLVAEGRAAMLFDTSAWAFFFEDRRSSQVAGRMGYTTVAGPRAAAQFLYAEGLGVTAWCPDPGAAAEFIRWRHSEAVVRDEVETFGRLDVPRTDLWDTQWYQDSVAARGLRDYLAVVRASWELADVGHVPRRVDYVPRAREVMAAISAVVSGRRPTLADALRDVPAAGVHGR
jgi:ABC-type glycerol-3-phosphate transport system substrate-binding protein